jgi:hypothetical protein
VKNRLKRLVLNDQMRVRIPELLAPFFMFFPLRSLSVVFLSLFLIVTHDDMAICSDQESSFENESWNRDAANCGGNWPQRSKSIALGDNRDGNEAQPR